MILNDKKLLALLQLSLRDMIDYTLETQSLKVMTAYQRRIETQLNQLERSLKGLSDMVDAMKGNYETYRREADQQKQQSDDKSAADTSPFPTVWIRTGMPMKSLPEIANDTYEQWQDARKHKEAYTEIRDHLQQRLQVTQTIHTTLQTNDFPTLEDAVLKSVYDYADLETERMTQALSDMEQRHGRDYSAHVRHMMRLTRRDSNSGFAI